MKYLLMIYVDEAEDAKQTPTEQEQIMGAYFNYTNELRDAGILHGGEALHPVATATTVRVRDGKVLTTDGPFAETKEQLGGYYLIDGNNLDEAIKWASKIPHVTMGSVEIRPIVDFSQAASA
jgi:hypothetical protein